MKGLLQELLSVLACKLGRHDYEAESVVVKQTNLGAAVLLECLECGHRRSSWFLHKGEDKQKMAMVWVPIVNLDEVGCIPK